LTLNNSILSNSVGGTDLAGQIIAGGDNNTASVLGTNNLVMSRNLGDITPGGTVISLDLARGRLDLTRNRLAEQGAGTTQLAGVVPWPMT
jgi:hypothetical protein